MSVLLLPARYTAGLVMSFCVSLWVSWSVVMLVLLFIHGSVMSFLVSLGVNGIGHVIHCLLFGLMVCGHVNSYMNTTVHGSVMSFLVSVQARGLWSCHLFVCVLYLTRSCHASSVFGLTGLLMSSLCTSFGLIVCGHVNISVHTKVHGTVYAIPCLNAGYMTTCWCHFLLRP